jgi:hypothetical protein
MAQRLDASSLSFGARVAQLEDQAVVNARRVKELEQNQSTKTEKDLARELQKARRAERQRATGMIASYDTTAEELQSLDTSSLTNAQQHLVGERIKQLAFANAVTQPFSLSFDASRRIENWRKLSAQNPTTNWGKNNTQPGFTTPLSNYERWMQNTNSQGGRESQLNRLAHEFQMSFNAAKEAHAAKPKKQERTGGFTLGRIKDI